MGCDGGTIPKRDELVRTKKKPEQKDQKSERAFRWKHCAVSQERLQKPVVGCELGRLYNKDAVIEALLDKSKATEVVSHLRSLRDVKDLNLTENSVYNDSEGVGNQGDGYVDSQTAQWVCPVVGQEMNGKFRFVFLWTCGCVLSERAIKEIGGSKSSDSGETTLECLKCQKKFTPTDVIQLNPSEEEEISSAQEKMEVRREKAKSLKKQKKQKQEATFTSATSATDRKDVTGAMPAPVVESKAVLPSLKRKEDKTMEETEAGPSSSSTSKKSKVVPKEQKPLENRDTKSLLKYTVAKDPKASETYKSLFTTHSTAKQQEKAHWITYNPFYN